MKPKHDNDSKPRKCGTCKGSGNAKGGGSCSDCGGWGYC